MRPSPNHAPRPRHARCRTLLPALICALLLIAAVPVTIRAQTPELSGKALVDALRAGGYTLYFRHAATEWSQSDHVRAEGDWTSCDPARMRQLSDAGRETVRRIGAAMRRLGIPVGRVRASEYCRTVETARLLGVGEVEPTRDILNMNAADYVGGREAAAARALATIAMPPRPGTNTVLVAHGNVLQAAVTNYLPEGGAAMYTVRDGEPVLVAKIPPEAWAKLVRQFAKAE